MGSQLPVFELESPEEGKTFRGVIVGRRFRFEVDFHRNGTSESVTLSLDDVREVVRKLGLRFGLLWRFSKKPAGAVYYDTDGSRVEPPEAEEGVR